MAGIGHKLETKGVIMALLSLVLISIGCEDKIDPSAVNPSERETVEVTLNLGIANEEDGVGTTASPTSKASGNGNKAAFEVLPVAKVQTKAEDGKPDQLYNLEIIQYNSTGSKLQSQMLSSAVTTGTTITVSLTAASKCKLLLIAHGNSNYFSGLSGKTTLDAVRSATDILVEAKTSSINGIATDATGSALADMPYYLLLEDVNIIYEEGRYKIQSTEGSDVRLLLKRLAAKVRLDWIFSQEMTNNGYTLKEVKLCQVPAHYRLIPETETTDKWGEVYPSSIAEFVDVYRLTGTELDKAKGTKTVWIPANARGISSYSNSPYYRNRTNANPAATYAEFVVDNSEKKERLYYRVYLGGNETDDFNLLENTNYHWTVKINKADYTSDPRIQLLDQTPVKSTNEQPTSNCFMMPPGTNICFNPYKHDAEKDGYNKDLNGWNSYLTDGNTITDDKKITQVKIVWQTKDNGTTGELVMGYSIDGNDHSNLVNLSNGGDLEKARIHVKIPNTQGGNALIAAYNSDGTVVWSWHLWITGYVPKSISSSVTYEQAQNSTLNGSVHRYNNTAFNSGSYANKVIMDRNLGAIFGDYPGTDVSSIDFFKRTGIQYLWGRKDPFFGIVDGTTNEIDILYDGEGYSQKLLKTPYNSKLLVNGNMMQYTIEHPMEFITNSHDSWYDDDWNGKKHIYLYGESKTLYDPCPTGWKIAPKIVFDGLTGSNTFWYAKEKTIGGRLYNVSGNSSRPDPITIHNSAWFPVAGNWNGTLGQLKSGEKGYVGTSTIGTINNAYWYLRFGSNEFTSIGGSSLSDTAPFRCIQK